MTRGEVVESDGVLERSVLGWMPLLTVVAALGVLLVSIAYAGARAGGTDERAYWLGLVLIVTPIFVRMLSLQPARPERLALLVVFALALYLVKVLHSPVSFTIHDEFSHWRTASDIREHGRLFADNPLLTPSPYYPGLELATLAITYLTGLSLFQAGILLVGAARLLHVVTLFLLFERLSGSARIAAVGALVYATNPSFLFFDAAYSYESIGLPLATAAVYLVDRWSDDRSVVSRFGVLALLVIVAVAITHHVTAILLTIFLLLWALVARLRSRLPERVPAPAIAAGVAIAANLIWIGGFARPVVGYLGGVFGGAILGFISSMLHGGPRPLFARTAGAPLVPVWEPLVAYASVGIVLVALPFAVLHVWRRYRHQPVAMVLMASTILYPGTLALRLAGAGSEVSQRASEYLFTGIAFVLAAWVVGRTRPVVWGGSRAMAAVTAAFLVVFLGGVVVGVPPYTRLPGDYQVGADSNSIDDQGEGAAAWTYANLGPGHRIITDSANRRLQGSYGQQDPITAFNSGIGTAWPMFATDLSEIDRQTLRRAGIEYVIVDSRLTLSLPQFGVYFEAAEPDAFAHKKPMDPRSVFKWDSTPGVHRLYDSGDIVIYDVRRISGAR